MPVQVSHKRTEYHRVTTNTPVRHIRAQSEVLLNLTATTEKGGKEVTESHHEDQNPELKVDEYTE